MSKKLIKNVRAQAALILAPVIQQKGALNINDTQSEDAALLRELCYGSARLYPRLNQLLKQLLDKGLKDRDADVHALLIIGLYQLLYMRVPDHAVLDQSVRATSDLGKKWAKGLVNAILRNALRKSDELFKSLADQPEFNTAHPQWLADQIRRAWPEQAEGIFAAGNERPPMTLRANTQKTTAVDYLAKLQAAGLNGSLSEQSKTTIRLEQPVSVINLPGFEDGECSVQDEAAQWAAELLNPQAGQRVLDACAAPGGKTCHLLESAPDIDLTALDLDETRVLSIENNLKRLDLTAKVVCADAADTGSWWDGERFNRILIDAPCSGTGVIRRHPDIKLLRRESDISGFAQQQSRLLDALWPLLAPDGLLLYVTCSIMPAENEQQILAFLESHADASLDAMEQNNCLQLTAGMQSFPRVDGPDGFYFALLKKS